MSSNRDTPRAKESNLHKAQVVRHDRLWPLLAVLADRPATGDDGWLGVPRWWRT